MTSGGYGGTEIARFYAVIGADTAGFTQGVGQARSQWGQLQGALLAGVGIGGGFAAVTMATRSLAGAIETSIGNVISYETAVTGLRKTVDASEAEFAAIDVRIRSLSTSMPVGRDELANIGQIAGQLGIQSIPAVIAFHLISPMSFRRGHADGYPRGVETEHATG
jgi:hypothetical protein